MSYHVVDPDDIDPTDDYPCDRRSIADALDLANLTLAVFDIAPGEDLARQYHYHETREEAFYVLDGELHVETPAETFVVPEDRLFVVEPDSPIRPFNPADADESVRVLGIGAPPYDPGLPFDPDGTE
ncbi:cupin domain-containing protein [Haloarculaceae archaeon H-GB2-1]|nr:cupin domain-containing protein [Haloarculaceae archaeon H-GB1-1]MEA5408694.1 cupin domain-containing protein [Haloarculaceae archaeon H-GB2-1]